VAGGFLVLVALALWALLGSRVPEPDEQFAAAEAILADRFRGWRERVESAARRMRDLAAETRADSPDLFARAKTIADEECVDGVAVLGEGDQARVWAGRSFDAEPEDFAGVRRGIGVVRVLDLPAHRVLFSAQPAGPEIAVAFLAFDEQLPKPGDLASDVARRSGLHAVHLRFGRRNVPPHPRDDRPRKDVFVADDLVSATLVAKSESERVEAAERGRRTCLFTLLFAGASLASFVLWRFARSPFVAIALLLGLRLLLDALDLLAPLASVAATALTLLFGAILLGRASRLPRRRGIEAALAALGLAGCFALPRLFGSFVERLVGSEDVVLFDTVRVLPSLDAALLLASLCLLTGACFVFVHATLRFVRRTLRLSAPLPFLAVALGALPWQGPVLALAAAGASWALLANATRPEKAAALTFLAAIASVPFLYVAERETFVHDVATRARDLVRGTQQPAAARRLAEAAAAIREQRADRVAALDLATGQDLQYLALRLWSAADWDLDEPCAVQVWDAQGTLVSTFDFDGPPAQWWPGADKAGPVVYGEDIPFYVRDVPLRTAGDERLVGTARFAVPDRWATLLLAARRPPLFGEPLDRLAGGAPPLLIAELTGDGTTARSSTGRPADLAPPAPRVLAEARNRGWASAVLDYRGANARLVLAAGEYKFAALVFEENTLQHGGLVFAKVLLTYSAVCVLYGLVLLAARRGRLSLLFRHRVALVLVLLSVPPLLLLARHNRDVAVHRYESAVDVGLERRLDLAQTLLRERGEPVDEEWCASLAANYLADVNVYRGQELVATSRRALWDTGLLGRRLAAGPHVALNVEGREGYTGREFFGYADTLRAAYRKVRVDWDDEPLILGAPALEDPQALDRRAAETLALLLAIYLATAVLMVFASLLLARSLTRPVQELREATSRVAGGDLDATLPEGRQDEFGDLVRSFNRMTRELRDVQDLRVRAEKAAAWRAMASQIAHEIKNPLTPIQLTVQNLLASYREDPRSIDEDFETGAKLILDQIEALKRIAAAFSAYASFPAGRPQPFDLNGLVSDVGALYQAEGAITVERADGPLTVRADQDAIHRALINLVTNARQANASHVVLRAAREGRLARVDVIDDGAGIPREVLERIYEPSFTTKTSGTGLGMPIVKRIVDDHKGAIEIDSEVGRGTRVTIRLPLEES